MDGFQQKTLLFGGRLQNADFFFVTLWNNRQLSEERILAVWGRNKACCVAQMLLLVLERWLKIKQKFFIWRRSRKMGTK